MEWPVGMMAVMTPRELMTDYLAAARRGDWDYAGPGGDRFGCGPGSDLLSHRTFSAVSDASSSGATEGGRQRRPASTVNPAAAHMDRLVHPVSRSSKSSETAVYARGDLGSISAVSSQAADESRTLTAGGREMRRRPAAGGCAPYFIFSAAGMLPAVGAPLRTVAKVSISK
jgi:hypothetical protein